MNCIYIYKNHTFNSEIELDDFLINDGHKLYSKYGDLVFQSIYQANTCRRLEDIAQEARQYQDLYQEAKRNATYIDGEDTLEFKPPYIGVTAFLRGLTNSDDILLTPEFREFEYWTRRIKDWKNPDIGFNNDELDMFGTSITITDSITDKELKDFLEKFEKNKDLPEQSNQILELIRQVKIKWQNQGEIGTAIHDVLKRLFSKIESGSHAGELILDQTDQFLENLYFNPSKTNPKYDTDKLEFSQVKDIIQYARNLKKELQNKLEDENLSFFPEFQIVSKIVKEIPEKGDTILGIIDLLVVDSKGNAHVIDYKASPKNTFNSAKERTFWYQLGLYNKMLKNHNVNVNSDTPQVMIAPILMEGFRKDIDSGKYVMKSVRARDAEYLTDITTHATLHEVAKNLEEFIPDTKAVNLVPDKIVENMTKFESKVFAGINTSKIWTDEEIKKLIEKNGGYTLENSLIRQIVKKKDFENKSESELFLEVKKYFTETLPRKHKDTVKSIIRSIKKGIKENTSEIELPKIGLINTDEGASAQWFKNIIGKYCKRNYELIDNDILVEYGVILLKNNYNNQIDVLKLTSDDLDVLHKFNNSSKHQLITGAVESDTVQARKPGSLALKAYNGNVHLMETMAILNCIPQLTDGGYHIGNILVANPTQLQGMSASNEELVYNFNELAKHIENYDNNIKQLKFATKVQLARNRLKEIMSLGEVGGWKEGLFKRYKTYQSNLTELDSAISESDKRKILKELETLRQELEKYSFADIKTSLELYNEDVNIARSLYDKVILAIAEIQGKSFRQQTKDNSNYLESIEIHRNGVQSLMADNPGNLNNDTLNSLTSLVTEAYQNVREDMSREIVNIRNAVDKLKKAKSFNKFTEMTYGNAATLYKNMIKFENGDLLFKNPWKDGSLYPEEAEFLKMVLTKINENRFPDNPDFYNYNDLKYYRIPLAIGDLSSQVAWTGGLYKSLKDRLKRLNPKVWWEENQKKLTGIFSDTDNNKDSGKLYEMNNMFESGENNLDERLEQIELHGPEYFETNLETLLLKHIFAYSSQKHINTIMPMAKASMIHLIAQGHLTNKKYENATTYVENYIKNKIKNESLIDKRLQKTNAVISQIKQAASFLALGFSPVSYGYQIIQGLWNDTRLILQNYGNGETPFTFENFRFACLEVYKDMFKLGNKPTKSSLLNELYGFNDMDMNTYADKLKSDKYGLFNFTNLAFHCSSRPDFFNRMALFIAQMKHDGTWEAYSVNNNNELVYNWKNDKRFNLLAEKGLDSDSTDIEYRKQKGLYYAIAEQLEREHAMNKDGSKFRIGQPLPKPYTNQQIESFKSLSDNIYGYYSHEKKAMIQSLTIGSLWMQMRGYWSGKKNQYLGSQGIKLQGKYVQQKDDQGNLLWLKEENGIMIPTTENTGIPFNKWEGDWQEGIFLTLSNLISDSFQNGFKTTWEDMWYNEDPELRALYRSNLIQLVYDTTMFVVVGTIVTGLMQDWDDELKKEAKDSGKVDDAAVAAAAHMCLKMVSSSFGDFNFIESIGNPLIQWEPFALKFFQSKFADITDVIMGDKSFTDALFRMSSLTSNSKILLDTLVE